MDKQERMEHSWRAAEHEHQERELGWYLIISLIALVFFVIALLQKNFLFAVFILLSTGLIFSFARRRPVIFDFKVDQKGITIGKKLYPYERLNAFSFRDRSSHMNEIVVYQRGTAKTNLHIPIDEKSYRYVKPILAEHLPEVEHEDTGGNILADFLGF